GRDEPPVHAVAGEGVDAEEAAGERHAFALAPLLPPAHQECYPEVQPPRPHEGQQVAEPSLEAVLDPPRHPATFTRLAYRRAARAHGRAARLASPAAKMRPSGARVMAVGLRSEADLAFEPAGL